jgi:hypothetical protein
MIYNLKWREFKLRVHKIKFIFSFTLNFRPRLVHGIFTGKSKETKMEERIGGRAFGTEEIANLFLRNTVIRYRFHRKNQIHSDPLFYLPLRKLEATRRLTPARVSDSHNLFVSLDYCGWKYCSLVCCERKTLLDNCWFCWYAQTNKVPVSLDVIMCLLI